MPKKKTKHEKSIHSAEHFPDFDGRRPEHDHGASLKYSYICDKCQLPILSKHQGRHSDGGKTFHMLCEFGRGPSHIEDCRAALAANGNGHTNGTPA